jgi:hypothetical protein
VEGRVWWGTQEGLDAVGGFARSGVA